MARININFREDITYIKITFKNIFFYLTNFTAQALENTFVLIQKYKQR